MLFLLSLSNRVSNQVATNTEIQSMLFLSSLFQPVGYLQRTITIFCNSQECLQDFLVLDVISNCSYNINLFFMKQGSQRVLLSFGVIQRVHRRYKSFPKVRIMQITCLEYSVNQDRQRCERKASWGCKRGSFGLQERSLLRLL